MGSQFGNHLRSRARELLSRWYPGEVLGQKDEARLMDELTDELEEASEAAWQGAKREKDEWRLVLAVGGFTAGLAALFVAIVGLALALRAGLGPNQLLGYSRGGTEFLDCAPWFTEEIGALTEETLHDHPVIADVDRRAAQGYRVPAYGQYKNFLLIYISEPGQAGLTLYVYRSDCSDWKLYDEVKDPK